MTTQKLKSPSANRSKKDSKDDERQNDEAQAVLVEALTCLARDSKALRSSYNDGPPSRAKFRTLLACGLQLLARTMAEVAYANGVDRATVHRWVSGNATPHPIIAKKILSWLHAELRNRLREEEQRSATVDFAKMVVEYRRRKTLYSSKDMFLEFTASKRRVREDS